MGLVAVIVMTVGVIGFALHYLGVLGVGTPLIWGVMAVGGMVITVMTRRPGD